MDREEPSADTSCVPLSVGNPVVRRVIMHRAVFGPHHRQSSLLFTSAHGLGWQTSQAHFQGKGRLFFA